MSTHEPAGLVQARERLAAAARPKRYWRLEFDSDGAPFKWWGMAVDQAEAEAAARDDLAFSGAAFDPVFARLVACYEA